MPGLDREEYIEQAYFFRAFRERIADGLPAQEVLGRIGEELLSSTKLPLAVGFLASEIKHSGAMASAMARIGHYFAPFQTHVIAQAERDVSRFPMDQAVLILEKEAEFKARGADPTGLFLYQFEAVSRNRLGYTDGLGAIASDPAYDEPWQDYILEVRARLGDVDFADLIYLRSEFHIADQRRRNPDYEPSRPILFGEREGKIARANRGRDPIYLFMALQRQLDYPEVPRPRRPNEDQVRLVVLEQRLAAAEARLRNLEMTLAVPGARPIEADIDLDALRVKPEDTAGTPPGWDRRPPGGGGSAGD